MTTSGNDVPSGMLGTGAAEKFCRGWSAGVSLLRLWRTVARLFYPKLIRRLKGWVRLYRGMSELAGMSDRELRDLGINRVVIAAIRAGTYKPGSKDDGECIAFCPETGNPMTVVLKDRNSLSLTEEWMISTAPLEWVAARLALAAMVNPDLTRRRIARERTPLRAGGVVRADWRHSEPASAA